MTKSSDRPRIAPYKGPAGGYGSARSVAEILLREGVPLQERNGLAVLRGLIGVRQPCDASTDDDYICVRGVDHFGRSGLDELGIR